VMDILRLGAADFIAAPLRAMISFPGSGGLHRGRRRNPPY
jgi:hypothetical protein